MRLIARLLFTALFVIPGAALADAPDWNAVADVGTVEVGTTDEDGSERSTTVWLIVVDGQGYIRTGGTKWGENVVRKPEIGLQIEDDEFALRVEFVEDDALRERIETAFNEKYGWTDSLMAWLRGDRPKIMRLLPR